MVDRKVQPESVSESWPFGEVRQISANSAQKLSKEGLASQNWDWNAGWYRPSVQNAVDS